MTALFMPVYDTNGNLVLGPACALGALHVQERLDKASWRLVRDARLYLRAALTSRREISEVTLWNDKAGRTAEEVIDLYHEAIALALVRERQDRQDGQDKLAKLDETQQDRA